MKVEKNNPIKINSSPGIIFFFKDEKIIYYFIAESLNEKYENLKNFVPKSKNIESLFDETTHLEIIETDTLFRALLIGKLKLYKKKIPKYNLQFYKNFTYFSIDFNNVPYFTISENTLEQNKIHIGPFYNRFDLLDFIFVMNELYSYPACESKEFPCNLYTEKKCFAPCLNEGVKDIALKDYLSVNQTKIKELEIKREKMMSNLEFNKDDLINKKIKILKNYYEYLKFFYVTKELNYENNEVSIKGGLLKKIKHKSQFIEFQDYNMEYNKNEFLSVEKYQLDERIIIYNYLKTKINVDKVYKKRNKQYIGEL